jgi:FkbM family methyltransferase
MRLLPGDVISDSIAFTGIYELALSRRLCSLARRGGTMIDVGANLGYFSLLWAAAGPDNRCVAFEASPRNVNLLRENVSRNGMDRQIRVLACAAGAAGGTLSFDPGPADQTGWGGFTLQATEGSMDVDVVRVDEHVDAESIALLKIDAEGADTWVLQGCERLLQTRAIHEIWYEQNAVRMEGLGISRDAAGLFLGKFGYTTVPHGNPSLPVVNWRATPTRRP